MPSSSNLDDALPRPATPESVDRSSYIETLRALKPTQRLESAERLYWSARHLKEAAIGALHPDWTEAQIVMAARDAFARAR